MRLTEKSRSVRREEERELAYDIVIGEFWVENFEIGVVDVFKDCLSISRSVRARQFERETKELDLLIEGVFDYCNGIKAQPVSELMSK
jgi:hypothetical protein